MDITSANTKNLRVWDLPTRVFHWALTICVILLVMTGSMGGDKMQLHLTLGSWVLSLLIFRLIWGFVGGYWSRFVQFFYMPWTILRYLRGETKPEHDIGHNPLGSLSVWGLLCILGAQVATGLIGDDEIATQGPLVKFVSGSTSLIATSYHKHWGKWIIITLVCLHVAAILFYLLKKKQNLVKPMLKGDKAVDASSNLPASNDGMAQRVTALIIFVVVTATTFYTLKSI
jgi:cytochrome b